MSFSSQPVSHWEHLAQLELQVEIGRMEMPLEELMQLQVDSVLQLDTPLDSPVNIYANGQLVAQGELVSVEGNFGVRITKLLALS